MKINGVELSSTEYWLLKRFVDCYDGDGDVSEITGDRFGHPYATGIMDPVFQSLVAKGLIEGTVTPERVRLTAITQLGLDCVHDHEREETNRANALKEQRLHDYKVGAAGVLGGAVAGGLVSLAVNWLQGFVAS